MKQKRSVGRRILDVLLIILLTIAVLLAAALTYFSVTEYVPKEREALGITGMSSQSLSVGDSLTVMTWNIGYGALGDNADFFMEGGEMVETADADRVRKNLQGIATAIRKVAPDITLLQEVDSDSSRSCHIDETAILDGLWSDDLSTEALYHSGFVPYPLPPIGTVHMNLQTLSKYPTTNATRIQLPVPFRWPVRTVNLKRCLLVSRVPLKGSDRELILVNLHLEAYDDGEGKAAQTKMLRDLLQEEYDKGNYVIAAGDFNQSFSNVDMTDYAIREGVWAPGVLDVSDFSDDFILRMDHTTPTCRGLDQPYAGVDKASVQYYMVDGFIVSKNLRIDSLETQDHDFRNTDHNPVVLKATLV